MSVGVGTRFDLSKRLTGYGAVGKTDSGETGGKVGFEWDISGKHAPAGSTFFAGVGHDVWSVAPGTDPIPTASVIPDRGTVIGAGIKIPIGTGRVNTGRTTGSTKIDVPAVELFEQRINSWRDQSNWERGSSVGDLPSEFPEGVLPEQAASQQVAALQGVTGGDDTKGPDGAAHSPVDLALKQQQNQIT